MYSRAKYKKSKIKSVETKEGKTIERKVEAMINNKEPLTEGSPPIFTERKDGVRPEFNIRTDRWEIANDAMTAIDASIMAKRENAGIEKPEEKKEAPKVQVTEGKPAQGTAEQTE